MKKRFFNLFIVICTLFYLGNNIIVASDEKVIIDGLSFGIGMVYNTFSGDDFDGTKVIITESERGNLNNIYDVPKLDNGLGFGISFAYKQNCFGLEAKYIYSSHDIKKSYNGRDGKISLSILELNGKVFPFPQSRIQPFILGGICFTATLSAEKIHNDLINNEILDADYTTDIFLGGFNVGAGMNYHLSSRFFFTTEAYYRTIKFSTVGGVDDISDGVSGSGLTIYCGLSLTFWEYKKENK